MKKHLCKDCDETNPEMFYSTGTKSQCRACILLKKKEDRQKLKKINDNYDIDCISREEILTIHNELREHIDTLDDIETFNKAEGNATFREVLIAKIDQVDQIDDEVTGLRDMLIDTIADFKLKMEEMDNKIIELDDTIAELDDTIAEFKLKIEKMNRKPRSMRSHTYNIK